MSCFDRKPFLFRQREDLCFFSIQTKVTYVVKVRLLSTMLYTTNMIGQSLPSCATSNGHTASDDERLTNMWVSEVFLTES